MRYVLPVVGAVVGYFVGAPQIGWAIGSILGGIVDPGQVDGPKIGDLTDQTSQEGVPRPIVLGLSSPMAGNIIDQSSVSIVTSTQGGKGGPTTTSQAAYRTYAIGICEGPIQGIIRVWKNGILVYDANAPTSADAAGAFSQEDNAKFLKIARFYTGTFTQTADPDLEALHGVGTTPCLRGTAYMVMVNDDVTATQGAIPQFTFQVGRPQGQDIYFYYDIPGTYRVNLPPGFEYVEMTAIGGGGGGHGGNVPILGGLVGGRGGGGGGYALGQFTPDMVGTYVDVVVGAGGGGGQPGSDGGAGKSSSATSASVGVSSEGGAAGQNVGGAPRAAGVVTVPAIRVRDGAIIGYVTSILEDASEVTPIQLTYTQTAVFTCAGLPGGFGIGANSDLLGWHIAAHALPVGTIGDVVNIGYGSNYTEQGAAAGAPALGGNGTTTVNATAGGSTTRAPAGGGSSGAMNGSVDAVGSIGGARAAVGTSTDENYSRAALAGNKGGDVFEGALSTLGLAGSGSHGDAGDVDFEGRSGLPLLGGSGGGSGGSVGGDRRLIGVTCADGGYTGELPNPATSDAYVGGTGGSGVIGSGGGGGGFQGAIIATSVSCIAAHELPDHSYECDTTATTGMSATIFVAGPGGNGGNGAVLIRAHMSDSTDVSYFLGSAIRELAARTSFPAARLDVSAFEATILRGLTVTNAYPCSAIFQQLSQVFFFDPANYDGIVHMVPRGLDAAVSVTNDELVDEDGNDDSVDKVTRSDQIVIPRTLNLNYYDVAGALATSKQTSDRSGDRRATGDQTITTAVLMNADEAYQCVVRNHKVMIEDARGSLEFSLPDSLIDITPAQCLFYEYDGKLQRIRVAQIDVQDGYQKYTANFDRQSAYTSGASLQGIPAVPPTPALSTVEGPTDLATLDIQMLRDSDDAAGIGYYVAVSGLFPAWRGALVELSRDGGATYEADATATTEAIFGTLATALPSHPKHYPDRVHAVQVTLLTPGAALESIDLAGLLSRKNLAIIGDEIVSFQTVDNLSPGLWELSTLLRGRNETAPAAHAIGDRFVMLDRAALAFIPAQLSDIGKTLTFRATSIGETVDTATTVSITFEGETQTERAPGYLSARRDGTNLIVTWRDVGRLSSGWTAADGAQFTGFRVTLTDGTTTLAQDTTAQTLTQDVSGLSGSITVSVAGVNALIGAGHAAQVIIT